MEVEKVLREQPVVIVFQEEEKGGKVITMINKDAYNTAGAFAIIACDLVRHTAKAFKIKEEEVWAWVDKERNKPTGDIYEATRQ